MLNLNLKFFKKIIVALIFYSPFCLLSQNLTVKVSSIDNRSSYILTNFDTFNNNFKYRVTYNTPANYTLQSVYLNDNNVGKDSINSYTINNIYPNAKANLSLIYLTNEGVKINTFVQNGVISSSSVVSSGSSVRVTFYTYPGYYLDSIIVDGQTVSKDSTQGFTFRNVTSDKTIIVKYKINQYKITVIQPLEGSGTINLSDTSLPYGSDYTINVLALCGYQFDSLLVNNIKVGGSNLMNYDIVNLNKNLTIQPFFSEDKSISDRFLITTSVRNGTITMNPTVAAGCPVKITYAPNPGFILDSVIVDNINVTSSNPTFYSYSAVWWYHSIRVVYKSSNNNYMVRIRVENGTLFPNVGDTSLPLGGGITYQFSPNSGYAFQSITVNGQTNSSPITNYSIKNINQNYDIVVRYNIPNKIFNINTEYKNGIGSNSRNIDSNSTIRLTYSANQGYQLDSIFINNIYRGNDSLNGFTLRNVMNDINFKVVFSNIKYSLRATVENGSIFPKGDTLLNSFSNITYQFSPNTGFTFDSLIVNGMASTNPVNTYQILNINRNYTIKVKFKAFAGQQYTITGTYINGTGINNVKVMANSKYRITYQANSNYTLDSIYIDGIYRGKDSVFGYTINDVAKDINIRAVFKRLPLPTVNIITSVNSFGNISSSLTVDTGATVRITYSPISSAYRLQNVIVNNRSIGKDSMVGYTFYKVRGDSNISAIYELIPLSRYRVVVSVINGSANVKDTNLVNAGSNYSINFYNYVGFVFDSIVVNGETSYSLPNGIYTIDNIQNNYNINVYYSLPRFKIRIFYDTNYGTVTPDDSAYVDYGANYSIKVTPKLGYIIDQVLANGVIINQFLENNYVLSNITRNIDIKVDFIGQQNLTITSINLACPNTRSGTIRIQTTASIKYQYKLTRLYDLAFVSDTFSSRDYFINNLDTGNYKLEITYSVNLTPKTFTYNLKIDQPKVLNPNYVVDQNNRTITFYSESSGKKLKIVLNNKEYFFEQNSLTLPLKTGLNTIKLSTSEECKQEFISNYFIDENILVYPNPSSSILHIFLGGNDPKTKIIIYDDRGKIVLNEVFSIPNSRILTIDIANFANGNYILMSNTDSSKTNAKFIKR